MNDLFQSRIIMTDTVGTGSVTPYTVGVFCRHASIMNAVIA